MMKNIYCYFFLFVTFIIRADAQVTNQFGNPVIPDMIADASIQQINGVFYCYATTDGYDQGLKASGPAVVWKSKDFVNWSFNGTYFPSAANQLYWAPSKAVAHGGKYYIYPTVNGFMYAAVANAPDGPFKLAVGEDKFVKPYSNATLLKSSGGKSPDGIDAEIFVDDDQQAYVFWQRRMAAKLNSNMTGLDSSSIITIAVPRQGYSEGPIFFKRKGIYYYLYTLGGDEAYQYAYLMGRKSPLGPFNSVKNDIITTTDHQQQVFGPGHGSVFKVEGTDNYYFAYLEYGRGSTNRQTYVNKLEFNADGTIKPVKLTLHGVGALAKVGSAKKKSIKSLKASSIRADLKIKPVADSSLNRTESFVASFAADAQNGSRWMANETDAAPWIVADLSKTQTITRSELFFVRPTAGHAYQLEYSVNGTNWLSCGGHPNVKIQSPHTDDFHVTARYLRAKILNGVKGVWEWNIY